MGGGAVGSGCRPAGWGVIYCVIALAAEPRVKGSASTGRLAVGEDVRPRNILMDHIRIRPCPQSKLFLTRTANRLTSADRYCQRAVATEGAFGTVPIDTRPSAVLATLRVVWVGSLKPAPFIANGPAPLGFVGCWPLAIDNQTTHSGARPRTGSRLSLDVTGGG